MLGMKYITINAMCNSGWGRYLFKIRTKMRWPRQIHESNSELVGQICYEYLTLMASYRWLNETLKKLN